MKPHKHAIVSAHKFGGVPADYQRIHDWIDQSKAHLVDVRHRAALHNALGCWLAEEVFGAWIVGPNGPIRTAEMTLSTGQKVSVRDVAEQHVLDDLREIPTLAKCLRSIDHGSIDWLLKVPEFPAYEHASQSVSCWGGVEADYEEIHAWFDRPALIVPNPPGIHRAIFYTSLGVGICEQVFGDRAIVNGKVIKRRYITNSSGMRVDVRLIAETHIWRVIGRLPSLEEVLSLMPPPSTDATRWLGGPPRKRKIYRVSKNEPDFVD